MPARIPFPLGPSGPVNAATCATTISRACVGAATAVQNADIAKMNAQMFFMIAPLPERRPGACAAAGRPCDRLLRLLLAPRVLGRKNRTAAKVHCGTRAHLWVRCDDSAREQDQPREP